MLFHEAMDTFKDLELEDNFERAAAAGHEEAIWIAKVIKGVKMEWDVLREAFAKTEEPLGWYLAGDLCGWQTPERFEFFKKSAEAGCSWGQVGYAWCFRYGEFVEKDEKHYLELLEISAAQENPHALHRLGRWYKQNEEKEKALRYFRAAAELGWQEAIYTFARMLMDGEGCTRDLRQAALWGGKERDGASFRDVLQDARWAYESGELEVLDCDFNQLCYALGCGWYWNISLSRFWKNAKEKAFIDLCVDHYCSCVELQQKSILTFLFFWNQTVGVKDVGVMIGKRVWEQREDNLMTAFENCGKKK
jgi:tetratricopeptide (TPR) repeat protein